MSRGKGSYDTALHVLNMAMINKPVGGVDRLGILGVAVHMCLGLRAMPVLPDNTVLQYNHTARRVPGSLEHWEHNILEESQSIQSGLGSGVSDSENDVLVPATQY